jgi:hypothetical protein
MLEDKSGEPAFPPGALRRLLLVIATVAVSYYLHQLLDFSEKPKAMPPELSAAAAECILSGDRKSCETYERAKPDYPIDPGRAGR